MTYIPLQLWLCVLYLSAWGSTCVIAITHVRFMSNLLTNVDVSSIYNLIWLSTIMTLFNRTHILCSTTPTPNSFMNLLWVFYNLIYSKYITMKETWTEIYTYALNWGFNKIQGLCWQEIICLDTQEAATFYDWIYQMPNIDPDKEDSWITSDDLTESRRFGSNINTSSLLASKRNNSVCKTIAKPFVNYLCSVPNASTGKIKP